MEQRNFPHDAIYKTIFSEKPLVQSLILDFVKLPFVADFDFSTLEPYPASYATPAFSRHENDLVWRVQMNGHDCFIYIMLEFQSRSEKYMAARIAKYSTLLLGSLLDQGAPALSPILPLVIYNGETKWRAPTALLELFVPMPKELLAYQPNQKYFVVDIRHIRSEVVRDARGEASFFVRLERSKSPDETRTILKDVLDRCTGPQYDRFRRLLRNFVLCCMERIFWTEDLEKPMPMEDLADMYDNYPEWARKYLLARDKAIKAWERAEAKGLKKGLTKGVKKGLAQGIKEGRAKGMAEGRAEGMEVGRAEGMEVGRAEGMKVGRAEGMKVGRAEGMKVGRAEGMKAAKTAVLGEQIAALTVKLAERFGSVPKSWDAALQKLENPEQIIEVSVMAYTVQTPGEFEAALLKLAHA